MTAEIIPFPGTNGKLRDLAKEFIIRIDRKDTNGASYLLLAANLNNREKEILRGYINEYRNPKRN